MKRLISVIAAFAALMLSATSCGVIAGTSTGASALNPLTGGTSVGSALIGLYSQYKADGKVDLSNPNNLINLATLASGVQTLKGQSTTYNATNSILSQFASGLVGGSKNLVTQALAPTVTSTLTGLANSNDMSSLMNAATKAATGAASISNTAASVTNTINSLNSIFKLLK